MPIPKKVAHYCFRKARRQGLDLEIKSAAGKVLKIISRCQQGAH